MCRYIFIKTEFGYCNYDIDEDYGACIYNLYVSEDNRRQGRAKEILLAAISAIRSHGYTGCIGITASPKEGSIPKGVLIDFYKRMGLTVMNDDIEEMGAATEQMREDEGDTKEGGEILEKEVSNE
jgi:GNAT superfamily N-acetyltransferase